MTEADVKCRVRPGLFLSEYIVSIDTCNHHGFFEFVSDRSGVRVDSPPTDEVPVEGYVRVYLVGRTGKQCRILVPASGGSDSAYVDVPEQTVVPDQLSRRA